MLTLGWEYPPHIAGGLGVACKGLTDALARRGVSVDLVVPRLTGDEEETLVRLLDAARAPRPPLRAPVRPTAAAAAPSTEAARSASAILEAVSAAAGEPASALENALAAPTGPQATGPGGARLPRLHAIPARLLPYAGVHQDLAWLAGAGTDVDDDHPEDAAVAADGEAEYDDGEEGQESGEGEAHLLPAPGSSPQAQRTRGARRLPAARAPGPDPYGSRLFYEIRQFSEAAASFAKRATYDVVHAHDWMTFPAGMAIAAAHEVPFVAHVHSTEFDRSGEGANPRIVEVERAGLHAAQSVIAVSHLTRGVVHQRYGVPLDRISVVHNGVYTQETEATYRQDEALEDKKVVLYMGRVTFQKGPDYFVEAAARVLRVAPEAHFVMAGAGDMLPRLKARVQELGIEASFSFPGFQRGREVERMFCLAEVFVMPSVSEPFGLVALEAMSHRTPVIVSRQSGVAEALRHVLKIDFWDVDQLAAKIVALLRYPEVREEMVLRASEEVTHFRWDAAAQKVVAIYERLVRERQPAR